MYPRTPLPHAEQLARLKTYLRSARADLRRRYDASFKATKGRRDCPLEVQIKHLALDHAQTTVKLLEACVREVQRQEAMFYAPFKPGDCIEVERQEEATVRRYLVVDILPDKRKKYLYDCVALTKSGSMYKRGCSIWILPSTSSIIRASEAPLNDDGKWEAEYYRRCAETSRLMSMHRGDLRMFEAQKAPWWGAADYKRRALLDPPPIDRGIE